MRNSCVRSLTDKSNEFAADLLCELFLVNLKIVAGAFHSSVGHTLSNASLRYLVFWKFSSSSVLESVHWWPVHQRIWFKLSLFTFNVPSTSNPSYLRDLLSENYLASPIRFAGAPTLFVPRTRIGLVDRTFSVSASNAWNSSKFGYISPLNKKPTNWWGKAKCHATQLYNLGRRSVKFSESSLAILPQTVTELCAYMPATPVLRTYVPCLIAFCSRLEAASEVISGRFVLHFRPFF